MYQINETHDPNLKSWVESANDPNTDFPIQNLPFCTFLRREDDGDVYPFSGTIIGNFVLDHGVGFDEVIFSHVNPKIGSHFESFDVFAKGSTDSVIRNRMILRTPKYFVSSS